MYDDENEQVRLDRQGREQPAVDAVGATGAERGFVGGEEEDEIRDLLGAMSNPGSWERLRVHVRMSRELRSPLHGEQAG